MNTIDNVLNDMSAAVEAFSESSKKAASSWTTPRAPGKWSPSQLSEHVIRSLEEAAKDMNGQKNKMINMPAPIRPLVRTFLMKPIIRKRKLNKAKTNAAMNPDSGPKSPEEAVERLASAWSTFESTARQKAKGQAKPMTNSSVFGKVTLEDYIRFQEIHVLHHKDQFPAA